MVSAQGRSKILVEGEIIGNSSAEPEILSEYEQSEIFQSFIIWSNLATEITKGFPHFPVKCQDSAPKDFHMR